MHKIRSKRDMKNWCDKRYTGQYITILVCARLEWQQVSVSDDKNQGFLVQILFIPGPAIACTCPMQSPEKHPTLTAFTEEVMTILCFNPP